MPAAPIELRRQLQKQVLKANAARVIDVFHAWDIDGDGIISKREFRRAITPLLNVPAPPEDLDALFDSFDHDGSGEITLQELNHILRRGQAVELAPALREGARGQIKTKAATRIELRKEGRERGSTLGTVNLAALGEDGVPLERRAELPVSELLARALRKKLTRVIDLFREWDEDGDGTVSRAEFCKALPLLGLHASRGDAHALFDSWDPDGSGTISFQELARVLRGGAHAGDGRPGSAERRAMPPAKSTHVHRPNPSPALYFARLVSQRFVPPHPWKGSSPPSTPASLRAPASPGARAWQGSPGYSTRAAASDAFATPAPRGVGAAADEGSFGGEAAAEADVAGGARAPAAPAAAGAAGAAVRVRLVAGAGGVAARIEVLAPPPRRRPPPPPLPPPLPPSPPPFRLMARAPSAPPARPTREAAAAPPGPAPSAAAGAPRAPPLVALDLSAAARGAGGGALVALRLGAAAAAPPPRATPARAASARCGAADPWALLDAPPPPSPPAASLTMRACDAEMVWRAKWPPALSPRPPAAKRAPPRAVTRLHRRPLAHEGLQEYRRPQTAVGEVAPPASPPAPATPAAAPATPAAAPAAPAPPSPRPPPSPSPRASPAPGKSSPFPRVHAPPSSPRRRRAGPPPEGTPHVNHMEQLGTYRGATIAPRMVKRLGGTW